jgi:hypothetical protein
MTHIIAISCQKQQMAAVTEHESNTIAEYSVTEQQKRLTNVIPK